MENTVTQIKKYCDTYDTKYLETLEYKYIIFFQKMSVYALKIHKANHKLALSVLKYYNMDKDGNLNSEPSRVLPKEYKLSELITRVDRMSVSLTGARKGDLLLGSMKASNNAMIKIYDNIYPSKIKLDKLRMSEDTEHDLWNDFLNRLGSIKFFSKMDIWERKEWLSENEQQGGKVMKAKIQFIQTGDGKGNLLNTLPSNVIDMLMGTNENREDGLWTLEEFQEIYTEIKKKKTLLDIREFWKIGIRFSVVDEYDKLVIDILKGTVKEGVKSNNTNEIILISKIIDKYKGVNPSKYQTIGILVPKKPNLSKIAFDILIDRGMDIKKFKQITRGFTAAAYKSLLQKIIRFMPVNVNMGNGMIYRGGDVLLMTLAILINHPGAFVPNIQRFVSGVESCAKRLAVTIYEDSSVTRDKYNGLFSLLACALLKQRVQEWYPDKELILQWYKIALEAYNNPVSNVVDYQGEVKKPKYTLKSGQYILKNASAVLDELKSFPTDLGLARGWARDYPNIKTERAKQRPENMLLDHCIDQHWAPNFVYFFDSRVVLGENSMENTSTPYKPLLLRVFREVTGINPRLVGKSKKFGVTDFNKFEDIPFVKHTRRAQKLFLTGLQNPQKQRKSIGRTLNFNYELPIGWIAGMIGTIEFRYKLDPNFKDKIQKKLEKEIKESKTTGWKKKMPKRPKYVQVIVTLKVDDPFEMVVAKKPSRDDKYKFIFSQKEEEEIFEIAKTKLRKGLLLTQTQAPDKSLENCKIFLRDLGDNIEPFFSIRSNGGKGMDRDWNIVKNINTKIPILVTSTDRSIKYALLNTGDGVEYKYMEKIDNLLDKVSKPVIRRILTYLSSAERLIEMNRLSRDGGSTKLPVNLHDVEAYQIMLKISIIAPIALRPVANKPTLFSVPNGPVLWDIRNKIREKIIDKISQKEITGWNSSRFIHSTHKLMDHQISVLNQMITNHNNGYKGNLIWSQVGSGKTYMVFAYLKYLKDNNALPPYVIYTLPSSAIDAIITISKHFGINTLLMEPTKGKSKISVHKNKIKFIKGCKPQKYHVNLITHDHLIKCPDLSSYSPNSILLVDEVHKFLNPTLRTGAGLDLALIAREFVAFTGTPVIDSDITKIIEWLKQLVPFGLNKRNFWVAVNNMVTSNFDTGVITVSEDVKTHMNKEEKTAYQKLLPPGKYGGTNIAPTEQDWRNAFDICWDTCDRKIISLTNDMLNKKNRVFLVSRNTAHQNKIYNMLLKSKIKKSDIYVVNKSNGMITLTDESVAKGTPDYKIVIVTKYMATGYDLTRLNVMISSAYFMNNAVNTQLKGRINRVSQKEKIVYYYTVYTGLLTSVLERHNSVRSLSQAIQSLAEGK